MPLNLKQQNKEGPTCLPACPPAPASSIQLTCDTHASSAAAAAAAAFISEFSQRIWIPAAFMTTSSSATLRRQATRFSQE